MSTTSRVWLCGSPTPTSLPPAVRDDRTRIWTLADGDLYQTEDHRHRAHWPELTVLTDLVEVGVSGAVLAAAGAR